MLGGRRQEEGGRRTKDRGQRTENRGQRTEDRGRRNEEGGRRKDISLETIDIERTGGTPSRRAYVGGLWGLAERQSRITGDGTADCYVQDRAVCAKDTPAGRPTGDGEWHERTVDGEKRGICRGLEGRPPSALGRACERVAIAPGYLWTPRSPATQAYTQLPEYF